jgi:hypothetical protein
MKLGKKLDYARKHVESILRHDDEPLAARLEAAKLLRQKIEGEEAAARERETRAVKRSLAAE